MISFYLVGKSFWYLSISLHFRLHVFLFFPIFSFPNPLFKFYSLSPLDFTVRTFPSITTNHDFYHASWKIKTLVTSNTLFGIPASKIGYIRALWHKNTRFSSSFVRTILCLRPTLFPRLMISFYQPQSRFMKTTPSHRWDKNHMFEKYRRRGQLSWNLAQDMMF